jgi:hypothetical protein
MHIAYGIIADGLKCSFRKYSQSIEDSGERGEDESRNTCSKTPRGNRPRARRQESSYVHHRSARRCIPSQS